MNKTCRILMMGASYGSLLASKLLLAGHTVKLVCLPAEAQLINSEGFRVRFPIKGRDGLLEVDSRRMPGKVSADVPDAVDPAGYDLVGLAMQEPQYRFPDVRALMQKVAGAKIPCMSIMNMPPLTYLARLPGVSVGALSPCYTDAGVWDGFDPNLVTLCSPDPQAFRPPGERINVLQVGLPTNFKAARFAADPPTAMLRDLQAGIDAARYEADDGMVDLPVKLKVHDSLFVPLAKWSMLLAGNYRCIREDSIRSIKETVHGDLALSRSIYDWVSALCRTLGASAADQVPFEKYANAALSLGKPSSVARAVAAGATHVERTDRLVREIAAQKGMHSGAVDEIVAIVDARLAANRRAR